MKTCDPSCFVVLNGNKNRLLHKRFNDLNFKYIASVSKHNLVLGLPYIDFTKNKICFADQINIQEQMKQLNGSMHRTSSYG